MHILTAFGQGVLRLLEKIVKLEGITRHTEKEIFSSAVVLHDILPEIWLFRFGTFEIDECVPHKRMTYQRRNQVSFSFSDGGTILHNGEIGFATLPEQVHRKSVKKGFDFTLIVVGETGLGKSTLINSLFLTDLYKDRKILSVEERVDRTVDIEKTSIDIEEKGVKLRLTVVDTPGFGDAINCEENWKTIERYIDDQFNQFFKDESGLNRKNIVDNRVHCCLYFIPPFGHGLRQLDVEFMKRLHQKVNIVPVIAKADTLTPQEIRKLKETVLREVEENQIRIYQLPECDSDEDEEFKQQDKELKESIPFAVIGSTQIVEINGRKVRGRLYPWGIVEVENPKHSDFLKLRTFLISTHMQDLKDVTRDVHYESYRAQYITKISQQAARERNKLRRDSGPNFEAVSETDRLLQQKEEEIRKMQDMLQAMQQKLRAAGSEGDGPKEEGAEMNF